MTEESRKEWKLGKIVKGKVKPKYRRVEEEWVTREIYSKDIGKDIV